MSEYFNHFSINMIVGKMSHALTVTSVHLQDTYADQLVFTQGCIGSLMFAFKDNLIIIGLIALCVGFLEVK